MGQKVHPGGLRVGVIHDWKSNWYTGAKEFPAYLLEDIKIREHIYSKLSHAGLSDIRIQKDKQRITIDIFTARPGIVIGKSGTEVDALRRELHALTKKNVHININEIKRPELDAKLVAQSVAEQLQNRVSFRRAMKRSLASAMRSGAHGVRIATGGRLGGTEMSRNESYSEGRVPLHTLRADIDYGFAEAKTTFGRIGVKVWINKGEIMPEGFQGVEEERAGAAGRLGEQDQARRLGGRERERLGAGRPGRRAAPDREGLGPVKQRRRGRGRPADGGEGAGRGGRSSRKPRADAGQEAAPPDGADAAAGPPAEQDKKSKATKPRSAGSKSQAPKASKPKAAARKPADEGASAGDGQASASDESPESPAVDDGGSS
ncbi:MAG: 30S ribosomal protein S3 [Gaiellales bacterium]